MKIKIPFLRRSSSNNTCSSLWGTTSPWCAATLLPILQALYLKMRDSLPGLPFLQLTTTELQRLSGHLFPDAAEFVATIADALLLFPQLYPDMAGEGQALRDEHRLALTFAFLRGWFLVLADQCNTCYIFSLSTATQRGKLLMERITLGISHPEMNPALDHKQRYMQLMPALTLLDKAKDTQTERRLAAIDRQKTDPTYKERLAQARRERQQKRAAAQHRADRRSETRAFFDSLRPGHKPTDR